MSPKSEKKESKSTSRQKRSLPKLQTRSNAKKSKTDTSLPKPLYVAGFPAPPPDLKWETEIVPPGIKVNDPYTLQKFKKYMRWNCSSTHPYTTATSTVLTLHIDVPNLPFKMTSQDVGYGEVQLKMAHGTFAGAFTFVPMTVTTMATVEIGHYLRGGKLEGTISCRMWTANGMSNLSDIRTHLWARCQEQNREQLGFTLVTAEGQEVHLHKEVVRSLLPHLDKLPEMGKSCDRHTLPPEVGMRAVRAFAEFLYWGTVGAREWPEAEGQTRNAIEETKSQGDSKTCGPEKSVKKADEKVSAKKVSESSTPLGELWRIADYFQLLPLQAYLVPKIASAISSGICPFSSALALVKHHPVTEWKEAISAVLQKNPELLWQKGIDLSLVPTSS
jgi:hypothetical protein